VDFGHFVAFLLDIALNIHQIMPPIPIVVDFGHFVAFLLVIALNIHEIMPLIYICTLVLQQKHTITI
jgi:hypothetical protein